jgi:hypothetical protein
LAAALSNFFAVSPAGGEYDEVRIMRCATSPDFMAGWKAGLEQVTGRHGSLSAERTEIPRAAADYAHLDVATRVVTIIYRDQPIFPGRSLSRQEQIQVVLDGGHFKKEFYYEPLAKRLVLSGLGALLGPAGRP